MFVSQLRLEAAPAAAVTCDHDPAFHADAVAVEFFIVVRHALVGIDQIAGHVTVRAVHEVGRQCILCPARRAIAVHRGFVQARGELRRRDQLQRLFFGRGIKHVKCFDLRLPTPLAKLFEHELGIGLVVGRPDVVRLGRQALQPRSLIGRIKPGIEFRFQRPLIRGIRGGKSDHVCRGGALDISEGRDGDHGRSDQGNQPTHDEKPVPVKQGSLLVGENLVTGHAGAG